MEYLFNIKKLAGFTGLALAMMLMLQIQATPVQAQEDASMVKYRQLVMRSIGVNMGSIGEIFKNGLPHVENIPAHGENIATSAKLILAAFKKQITSGKTDAKAEIWQDWSKFEKDAEALIVASEKLASMAGADKKALGAQMKNVGKTCKACHEDFRKPKEESYKRK